MQCSFVLFVAAQYLIWWDCIMWLLQVKEPDISFPHSFMDKASWMLLSVQHFESGVNEAGMQGQSQFTHGGASCSSRGQQWQSRPFLQTDQNSQTDRSCSGTLASFLLPAFPGFCQTSSFGLQPSNPICHLSYTFPTNSFFAEVSNSQFLFAFKNKYIAFGQIIH